MDKALQLLSLARKGRRVEVGEEPVDACVHAGRARLVIVASDASEHTLRRIKNITAGTKQIWLQVPYNKQDLGWSMGRGVCAVAALTDAALAKSFVQALPEQEKHAALLEELTVRAERIRKRQKSEKTLRKQGKK